MPSRSSVAENLVLSTRRVHSGRQIIEAEAVQDTASLLPWDKIRPAITAVGPY